MAPTPLSRSRAAAGAATSAKAPTAAVPAHQTPNKPRNQLALLSLAGALLAAPAVGTNPAVAAELSAPAPVTHQVQHISSSTAVKYPSLRAPHGETLERHAAAAY
jgi:hypothetical protein